MGMKRGARSDLPRPRPRPRAAANLGHARPSLRHLQRRRMRLTRQPPKGGEPARALPSPVRLQSMMHPSLMNAKSKRSWSTSSPLTWGLNGTAWRTMFARGFLIGNTQAWMSTGRDRLVESRLWPRKVAPRMLLILSSRSHRDPALSRWWLLFVLGNYLRLGCCIAASQSCFSRFFAIIV